jgi:hypothetical protein
MEQIIPIQSWNPVWKSNAVTADTEALMPSFMFRPTIEILDLIQQGALPNNIIEIDIAGTNSLYDGIHKAVIDRSSIVGGDRPNYFATTNVYIATLYEKNWFSYPPVNGVFKVRSGILTSYKTNPIPEERMVQIVSPKPAILEGYDAPPAPASDIPVPIPPQAPLPAPPVPTDVTPSQPPSYVPLHTMPSLGAVAAGVYDATVDASKSFGVPVSYMFNEYRVPPSDITRPGGKIVENYCGCAAKFAPYAPSSRSYDQDASTEYFEMASSESSPIVVDRTNLYFLTFCVIMIALFYLGLRWIERS